MTQPELAAYVQSHMLKHGITVVLSGGAAVSIYTRNKYVSRDVDLVNVNLVERAKIRAAMRLVGFRERSRYFVHPDSPYLVEFPAGPLAIDDQPVTAFSEIRYTTGTLRVITPTDCVKDRLAAFYFWNDQQALSQAVMVARARRVNKSQIRRWSLDADMLDKYQEFLRKLSTRVPKR
jgi:hypothetical protein